MPESSYHEKQFYTALRDIFIGAKVEGKSGFINLMQIKSRYYTQGVFPRLKADIEATLKQYPDFREELFDKLYSFFKEYFSESGSIYFRYTPLHKKIYEKVYTDERDVILFWKTHMLYYVKTDRVFTSLAVPLDDLNFFFDASQVEHKRANEKRELVFSLKEVRPDQTLVFQVSYSERGSKTKEDDILRQARQAGLDLDAETLQRALRAFEKQSEVDYFINKDARAFLQEQFELWLYQYLFAGQNIWSAERLARLQSLKAIAYQVIDFISQFEDELVKVWNKPKFSLNSHYILTLDYLLPHADLLERLFAHPGMAAQLDEWRALGMLEVGQFASPQELLNVLGEKDLTGVLLQPQYAYLPVDTRHFPDLELDLLALFDNLDASLDGWLVHSENYQALNTLLPKFKNLVDTIFIDPPYNTKNNDFLYKDKFMHSSWLTMMGNRLETARNLLKNAGAQFITINDIEAHRMRFLLEEFYGEENFVANVVWQKKQSPQNDSINLSDMHDHILVHAKRSKTNRFDENGWERNLLSRKEEQFNRYSNPDNDPRGDWSSGDLTSNKTSDERPNLYYAINNPNTGEELFPPKKRVWRFEKKLLQKLISENRIWWGESGTNFPRQKRFLTDIADGVVPSTWWSRELAGDNQEARREIRSLFTDDVADNVTPKPTKLIQLILNISGNDESINLDFFAGSGTTAHAVMNLNREDGGKRKYILVEMGEHFHTVILPRLKKIAFHSKWKDGKPHFAKGERGMSHFVKYFDLEQYEETLQRARYRDGDLFDDPHQDPYHSYVFLRDLKMLHSLELDLEQGQVHFHPERLYPHPADPAATSIDLAESLSHLKGKWIKRIRREAVEFQDGEVISLLDPDWTHFKSMIWWS